MVDTTALTRVSELLNQQLGPQQAQTNPITNVLLGDSVATLHALCGLINRRPILSRLVPPRS
jgi:hypothetical protein